MLTIAEGVEVQLSDDNGLYVGYYGGAAGLIAQGTPHEPVVVTVSEQLAEGNVFGAIAFWDDAVDEQSLLEHVDIGFGGGSWFDGNVMIDDASPTIMDAYIHDGARCGIHLDGDSDPILEDISYSNNAEGGLCDDR